MKRKQNETYDQYRERRKNEAKLTKVALRGRFIYDSRNGSATRQDLINGARGEKPEDMIQEEIVHEGEVKA